eukprot:CAMPEP_0184858314 /NCGR_PEP_ID=MMETSP0580-20130426/3437_1 /TAXON_ID=1118495 /ORGANISM="Dactyliosolen fragilissimus" /LENGTH=144 /DNA_ID=CAMNT_0027354403 /DNA_START=42 /DNA_END=476 /DNA_ORIENTATION=-
MIHINPTISTMKQFMFLPLLLLLLIVSSKGFMVVPKENHAVIVPMKSIFSFPPSSKSQSTLSFSSKSQSFTFTSLQSYNDPNNNKNNNNNEDDNNNVNVTLINDIDPFTITAIGFALIAFNFFVFANAGDAGIAGLVARIINSF